MTTLRVRLIVLALALLFLLWIALQVRRRRLRAKYLVLWVGLCVLVLPIIAIPNAAAWLSSLIGVYYPPATLFLIAVLVLFAINMHFSREITRLEERTRVLAEELALERLEHERPPGAVEGVERSPTERASEVSLPG
jgi:hypothetical protein